MLFNSYVFIFAFLPLVVLGFALLGRVGRPRLAMAWLVAASLFFYGWWNPVYLLLIASSILFNCGVGRALSRLRGPRRALLGFGVGANLALLGYFKYANFFVNSIVRPLGLELELAPIVLPLAISFFTFQQIAYLVDAYRDLAREESLLRYALFVSFFPQLIAGPIVHHQEMLPQFAREETYRVRRENLEVGLSIFLAGLFKKVVWADGIAVYATPAYDLAAAGGTLGCAEAWIATWAYTLQIYFDFSGYSDMAIGLGRMLGVRLPLNFNSPYKAASVIDFWRRWHVTLSRFLRDYLYVPLGGNRRGPRRRYANLMVTMLLGGLWHGAGWTFLIWGALHGSYLLLNHAWRGLRGAPGGDSPLGRAAGRALTFLVVLVAWVFFRAADLPTALGVLRAMASPFGDPFANGLVTELPAALGSLALLSAIAWFAPNTEQIMARFDPVIDGRSLEVVPRRWQWLQWRLTPARAVAASLVAAWAIAHLTEVSEFLYFQF